MRLSAITYAAEDINLYRFSALDGYVASSFDPGAHIDLYLPNGMMRQYSLANVFHAGDNHYVVGVKLDPASRGGSRYMHEALRVGVVLDVGLPRNQFPLQVDAPHSVFIAGGIGITPIYCMITQLHTLGCSWELHFAVKRRAEAAFLTELEAFARLGGSVHLHIDEERQGDVLDIAGIIGAARRDAHFYCCGPKPMLDVFVAASTGLPGAQVHLEYFSAELDPVSTGGFKVILARSGLEVEVPTGCSIARALEERGVELEISCEQGVCGACQTRVLEGIPDHRDLILSEQERLSHNTMMICCSGSLTPVLVLDL